jgi:hypothetical protein
MYELLKRFIKKDSCVDIKYEMGGSTAFILLFFLEFACCSELNVLINSHGAIYTQTFTIIETMLGGRTIFLSYSRFS